MTEAENIDLIISSLKRSIRKSHLIARGYLMGALEEGCKGECDFIDTLKEACQFSKEERSQWIMNMGEQEVKTLALDYLRRTKAH